jgi:hypothetical protein
MILKLVKSTEKSNNVNQILRNYWQRLIKTKTDLNRSRFVLNKIYRSRVTVPLISTGFGSDGNCQLMMYK